MSSPRRYERYAAELTAMIRSGELAPGARLPSIREASATRRISPSTAFEAYYLLQARGLIESRPRSGFFVRQTASPPPKRSPPPASRSQPVAVSDLVFEVLAATRQPGVAPLGSAFPSADLFPLQQLARALSTGMRQLDPARIVEDLTPGNATLRQQIALRYALSGTRVSPDEIVLTNGALEALTLSLQAVTAPGDAVVVESPCFYAALQALERLGLQAIEIACDVEHGLDLEALREALRRHAVKACWLMPSFQNPTGSSMPDANRQALVQLLEAHDVPLIEDDVYGELYHGAHPPRPAKAFDTRGLVMHCGSFSKCLAPGYRIGWVAAGRHAQAIERAKIMTTLSCAVPSQQALVHYLAHGGYERHLRALRRTLARQCDLAARLAARYFPAGTRLSSPQGGYFLWVEFPTGIDTLQMHRDALARGINIAPGQIFSATRRFGNCLRVNFGHPRDARFEPALRTIGELASAALRK
ncbi:MAG: PLP-dependent aminotransferase family protein [Steroidobacteraceae bacterium]